MLLGVKIMLSKKSAQGMSITVIVAAVIGLIIIVVIVAVLTGKLGTFSTTASAQGDCSTVCKAAGYSSGEFGGPVPLGMKNALGQPCKCT